MHWKTHPHFGRPLRGRLFGVLACTVLVAAAGRAAEPPRPAAARRSFRHDVQPVLTKAGCNSGACHGALAGKGGFKLSLRGYDSAHDYLAITHQARGRRIELHDPARSLVLLKATATIPHKGGLRFATGSLEYRIIAEWIAQGAPPPAPHEPMVERIEVSPAHMTRRVGQSAPLQVNAHFTDGRVLDVTRWAKFSSTNATVAKVDDRGNVAVIGHGAGAVMAWYQSHVAVAGIMVPYPHRVTDADYRSFRPAGFIDRLVLGKWRELHIAPSPAASDATMVRRLYLDLIGRPPTIEEARRHLADHSASKWPRLVDELMARPEFVDYWTYRWCDLLLVNGKRLRPKAVVAYYDWIHEQVARNRPWDEFVREILTARGSSFDNGATNFYALHQRPEEIAENVSVAFLGININCARCHNHPLEKWTNDQYYAFANLFARVRAKGWGGDPRNGDGRRTLVVSERGDLVQPSRGRPQPPAPLDAPPLPIDDPRDRRAALADWMTAPDNPYFARAVTNRIWAAFFGVGIVDPVDDLRQSNPPSHAELLDAAAHYLIANRYDLRALMRAIVLSETYRRSSRPLHRNRDDRRFYSHYYPRRLMAEVLHDAICQATGVPTPFTRLRLLDGSRQTTKLYPLGTRAIQLKDSAVESSFLESFGRNERMITCECERSNEPSLVQVLHLNNGDTIRKKLQHERSIVGWWIADNAPVETVVDEAFLRTVARRPTARERRQLERLIRTVPEAERREVYEDLMWSLLTSREFLFQH